MPYCAACAYAFPADEGSSDVASSVPAAPSVATSEGAVDSRPVEPSEVRPVHSPANSSTSTKILAAFAIVVGVLFLAGLTMPEGPVVIVLLNPIFWIAAVVAGVLLFRRGRKVLAVAVVGTSAAAVLGMFAMLYFSPQVIAVASPSPSAPLVCNRSWFNSSGDLVNREEKCGTALDAPDFCFWDAPPILIDGKFVSRLIYMADYSAGTYDVSSESDDYARRHNHPDGACPDLD